MSDIHKQALDYMFGRISDDTWIKMITMHTEPPLMMPEWSRQWQPIETAPKDGIEILIYEPPGKYAHSTAVIYVCFWKDNVKAWVEAGGEIYSEFDPTHWMPLPAPPSPKPAS